MDLLDQARQKMQKAQDVLVADLATVRTGRAAPSIVEGIVINAYGGSQRLKVIELAHVTAPDPQTVTIAPFDVSIIGEINKGIMEANIGLNPVIDGQLIRINIPQLSQERREQLIQLVSQKLEAARIQVRQIRHEAMNDIKKQFTDKELTEDDKNRLEKEAQKITDDNISKIDLLGDKKKEELMQI